MTPCLFVKTSAGVSLECEEDGAVVFRDDHRQFAVRAAEPEVFTTLADAGAYEDDLARRAFRSGGLGGMARFYHELRRLVEKGLVTRSSYLDGRPLATLTPTSWRFHMPTGPAPASTRLALSRFAFVRREWGCVCVESPCCLARVVLHDPRAAGLVFSLMDVTTDGMDAGLPPEAASATRDLLWAAGLLTPLGDDGATAEDLDPTLRCWEFHDLLFHAWSRAGRTDRPVGATYAWAGVVDPPPVLKPLPGTEAVPLPRPDMHRLERDDPPFARVMEQRVSVRTYGRTPISLGQLAEFLFRVARVKRVVRRSIMTSAGPLSAEFAPRPYPAGGSLYEIEIYLAVRACGGVQPGLYYYDPIHHALRLVREADPVVGRLLDDAGECAGTDPSGLQVLLISAARFPRVSWKYSGLAYSLVLKHAGIVQQSMYLAATAMGLGGCALGVGDSDLFAHTAGTDYYAESSVGEFLLGTLPEGREKEPAGES